jgi:hypothetical protein
MKKYSVILILALLLFGCICVGSLPQTQPPAPKNQCLVYRPGGPETTENLSLQGDCNKPPQYVAYFQPVPGYKAIGSGSIVINHNFFQNNSFTILGWSYYDQVWDRYIGGYASSGSGTYSANNVITMFDLEISPPYQLIVPNWGISVWEANKGSPQIDLLCNASEDGPNLKRWYQWGVSWNNVTREWTVWVNGASNCTYSIPYDVITTIGPDGSLRLSCGTGTSEETCSLSNVQLYHTVLSPQQVQALYSEGIGGAPIDLQNLVGWWHLNGDANDYSGNGYNGEISDVTFNDTNSYNTTPNATLAVSENCSGNYSLRIWPSGAPNATCWGTRGAIPSTGNGSGDWFDNCSGTIDSGCSGWKIFNVTLGSQIEIHGYGDNCHTCDFWHIHYYLDDYYNSTWNEIGYIDGPDRMGDTYNFCYTPKGDKIRIRSDYEFYVQVFGKS